MSPRGAVTRDYTVFDHMIEGVQIIDHDFRYVYVNHAVAAHGKTTREALVGHTMHERYPGIEHTPLFELIRDTLTTRQSHQLINEFSFPDGSVGYFQLRVQPVPEGALILSFDVTTQKRAEEIVRQANETLQAQKFKLEAKNKALAELTYICAHDLQEPLRTLESYVEVLLEECEGESSLSEDALASLSFISGASRRMQALVRALMSYSRLDQTHERVITNLNTLLAEVVFDLNAQLEDTKGRVEVERLPTLAIYRPEFAHLMQSLLSNAIKYHRPGVPPHVRVTAARAGDLWRFQVSDNGIGFEMRHKDKIFQMFQRLHTDAAYPGTGIGLAACKKVVSLHGGDITCSSVPGEGSTFTFTISAPKTEPTR